MINSHANGSVTIDPNGAETIDGATTITLLPGQHCIVFCNGTLFRTIGHRTAPDYVRAHKNGTDQTGIANATDTPLSFSTEDADTGGRFDVSTSRFTPPTGTRWLITATANLTASNDGMSAAMALFKDGAVYPRGPITLSPATGAIGVDGQWIVEGDGGYFELYITLSNSTASRTVEGNAVSSSKRRASADGARPLHSVVHGAPLGASRAALSLHGFGHSTVNRSGSRCSSRTRAARPLRSAIFAVLIAPARAQAFGWGPNSFMA